MVVTPALTCHGSLTAYRSINVCFYASEINEQHLFTINVPFIKTIQAKYNEKCQRISLPSVASWINFNDKNKGEKNESEK